MTPDGRKEVVALEDGYRESTESWLTLLRDTSAGSVQALKRRGMPAPKLAVADGALGFWKAMRQVYPKTEEQRCWVHKSSTSCLSAFSREPKRNYTRSPTNSPGRNWSLHRRV